MKIVKVLSTILISSTLLLAQTKNKQESELKSIINEGKNATKLLLQTLQTNLEDHMKDGPDLDTLDFCSNEAYRITKEVNQKFPNGVSAKRISEKYRNPANAPQEDESKVLDYFEKSTKANAKVPEDFLEKVDANTYKFYTPIFINKSACLSCHGDLSKDLDIEREIASRYPIDRAKGYNMDDLRGAVVVTIKR